MKKIELAHERVFSEVKMAESYYRRQKLSIRSMGKNMAKTLKSDGLSDGKLLDVGCGFAAIPIEIAKAVPGVHILGVDLSEPLLEIGRNDICEAGFESRIELRKGDAHNLDFPDNSFEAVINTFLLHIVKDPIAMLNEIERVAKPGACIIIADLRRIILGYFIRKFHMTHSLKEAVDIIESTDLREGVARKGLFWWEYRILTNQ